MRFTAELQRLLLPNCCVVCERMLEQARPDDLVCAVCRSRFQTVAHGCERCGQPLPPIGPCRFCIAWPDALGKTRSAVWLTDGARDIVHRLKYDDFPALARVAAEVICRTLPRPEGDALVPIPLARRKLRLRGYNQAELLARELGRRWSMGVQEDALSRARETTTQTALTPEARLANVAAAFSATRAAGRSAIVVDDVLTTGATLRAAATSLAAGGWPRVAAVTFARALPFERRALVS
jgi:ComF family protein